MADNEQNIPVTLSTTEPSNVETSGNTNENREDYIVRMESEIQHLHNIIDEMHRNQATQTPIPTTMPTFSIPIHTMPTPIMSTVPMPPPTISEPFYFQPPTQSQGAPQYTFIPYPISTGVKPQCTYKQFLDCKPPEYKGSNDPTVTLNWLREMERTLDAANCEERMKVKYASRMLKERAMQWWDVWTKHMSPAEEDAITWKEFYDRVCDHFCNEFEMNKIRKEFMNLQMSDRMSVDELIKQFNDKLRFVKQWVPDEKAQLQHFVEALLPDYRGIVRTANTLTQAFNLARFAEGDHKAKERMNRERGGLQRSRFDQSGSQQSRRWQGNQRQSSQGSNVRRPTESISSQRSQWCNKCKSYHSGPCTAQTMKCIRCGQMGHEVKDCKFPRNVCWNCQKEGHRVGDCPTGKRFGSGSGSGSAGGSLSSTGQKRKNPPPPEGRAFQMTVDDAMSTDDVITGKGKAKTQ